MMLLAHQTVPDSSTSPSRSCPPWLTVSQCSWRGFGGGSVIARHMRRCADPLCTALACKGVMRMRKRLSASVVPWSIGVVMVLVLLVPRPGGGQAPIGSNDPDDMTLQGQRSQELDSGFIVDVPAPGTSIRPVERVPRKRFGVVGHLARQLLDLEALVYLSATLEQRQALVEGMQFFTTPH